MMSLGQFYNIIDTINGEFNMGNNKKNRREE